MAQIDDDITVWPPWFLTYPCPVEEDADKHGRNGEIIDEGSYLEHEVQFVVSSHKLEK